VIKPSRFQPTIFVTDAGRGSAVAIIRSLGRRGWRVIAGDSRAGSPGLRSRYAASSAVYPAPETSPERFVEFLREYAQRQGVDLIIPVTDAAILPLVEARDQFEPGCRLAIPQREALEAVLDKSKTLACAARLGVPIPRT
jgi:predicted ATP-grasp superfamily ATP-dependent carboligase